VNVNRKEVDGVAVFELDGGLGYDNFKEFNREMEALMASVPEKVVFDLERLTYLSSWGIGILVTVASRIRKRGGRVKFANLHTEVAEVLKITRLDRVLELYPSLETAIESFE